MNYCMDMSDNYKYMVSVLLGNAALRLQLFFVDAGDQRA